jgi:CMD domain protein
MTIASEDVIDALSGIEPGSQLYDIRGQRQEARDNAQKSYAALFQPEDFGGVSALERFAVATFVAKLHRQDRIAAFYEANLRGEEGGDALAKLIGIEAGAGLTEGPYGDFPAGPLSAESKSGLIYKVSAEGSDVLGARLSAILEHTHLLVFRPRDAGSEALGALLAAGWSTTDVVTLSQLVSFLAFQIRAIAGLSLLAREATP